MNPKTAVFSVAGMKSWNSTSEKARVKYSAKLMSRDRALGEEPAEHPGEVHDDREQRQRDDTGEDARHRQELERVDGRGLERVDLLGHPHRAELGADARADAARHEQTRGERAGLADQRDGEAGRDHRLGAEPLERRARVHRQHDANGEAGASR